MDLTTFLLIVIGGLLVYIILIQLLRPAPPPLGLVVMPAVPATNTRSGASVLAALLILGGFVVAVYLGLLPTF